MAEAQICPVCGGTGKVYKAEILTCDTGQETCHGCGGCGWVTV